MSDDPPPLGAMTGFLRLAFDGEDDPAEPGMVLRGSLLLALWYGSRARTPADIDVECFIGVDYCKMRIRQGMPVHDIDAARDGIRFWDAGAPGGGSSLWVYGTPGERYYAGCEWGGWSGRLQIDLAEPGRYTSADLGVVAVSVPNLGGVAFTVPAYSPEAMLAAKLSWLVRAMRPDGTGVAWAGEPKDLFDAHLLLTAGDLRPDLFRRALLAVGLGDGVRWPALHNVFLHRQATVTDATFADWPAFADRYPGLASAGPVAMWAEVADRFEPLLGDLLPFDELPLLAGATDELGLLVYADWLDDRGDPRGAVVRNVARLLHHPRAEVELATHEAFTAEPLPGWLYHLLGTTAAVQAFRDEVVRP